MSYRRPRFSVSRGVIFQVSSANPAASFWKYASLPTPVTGSVTCTNVLKCRPVKPSPRLMPITSAAQLENAVTAALEQIDGDLVDDVHVGAELQRVRADRL